MLIIFKRFFRNLFDLHKDEDDKSKTLENVRNNVSVYGSNLWILVCAILVASVGLNVNSTAVIIGAMLISPLMGPIVSAGFALGIYDFELLKKSLRNLLIATVASLIVSTIYFYISPFKDAQSELLSRTSPNIYDILIAFFGGLVGVIAVTRVEKGNPIPGVAIATALMPPLCTAGYGLATGNIRYFLGALFLYTINCVFICIATFSIVKYLKYPAKEIDLKHQKRVKYGVTAIVFLMIIPSAYFAYSLYEKQKFQHNVDLFIDHEFLFKGSTLVYKKTDYNKNPKTIELAFLDKRFDSAELSLLNQKLQEYSILNTKIIIKQDSAMSIDQLKNNILNEINDSKIAFNEKDVRIQFLEKEIAKSTFDNKQILKESKALFPSITSISIASHDFYTAKDSSYTQTIMLYSSDKNLEQSEEHKFNSWLQQRLGIADLKIIKE